MLVPTNLLYAQDHAAYCDQLEAADCQLLDAASNAMRDISSAEIDLQLSINMLDIPDMPFAELFLQYDQSSAFMMNDEAKELISQLQSIPPVDLQKLANSPTSTVNLLRTILGGTSFGLDMRLQMSDEIAALLSEELRLVVGVELPTDLGIRIMSLDGILYMDTRSIAPYFPDMGMFLNGWVGVESGPFLDMVGARLSTIEADNGSALILENGDTQSDNTLEKSIGGITFGMAGPLVTTLDRIDPNDEILKFVDIERVLPIRTDEEVSEEVSEAIEEEEAVSRTERGDRANTEGVQSGDTAIFRTTINYPAFFQSPIFRDLVHGISMNQGPAMSAEELDETVTLAQIMGPTLLQGLELYLLEEIGIAKPYLYYSELLLDWDLTSLFILAASDDPSIQVAKDATPSLGIEILSSSAGLNEPIRLSPPDGAFVIPQAMLMQMAGQ
ncbi:MAG: hypothetical protein AAF702_43400 [Chloroflexota bacterium]